jgi:hypothetical protein
MSKRMKERATLVDYFERLTPKQQDLLVYAMQKFSSYPDFHRGMIPFLRADEARQVLYELMTTNVMMHANAPEPEVIRIRPIKAIIGVFEEACTNLLPGHTRMQQEVTWGTLILNDQKMAKRFRLPMKGTYLVDISLYFHEPVIRREGTLYVELHWLRKNTWEVTAPTKLYQAIANLLVAKLR